MESDAAFGLFVDEEAQEGTALVSPAEHRKSYETVGDEAEDLDEETVLDIAGDIEIIDPRKYRFKPTSRIPSWPLRLMPHTASGTEGVLSRRCVVTAVAVKGLWLKVRVRGGREGWMQSALPDGTVVLEECKAYRRHEEWGGRNRFFLCGRVMLGSDVRFLIGSNITLTAPVCLFVWAVCLRFPVDGGVTLGEVGIGLWAVAIVALWVTAMTDPGIIPPNPSNARALPPQGEARRLG